MAVFDLAALAEECIGLGEEKDGPPCRGGTEDSPQVFLRLADVLADDLAQIDAIEIEVECAASTSPTMVLPVPLEL